METPKAGWTNTDTAVQCAEELANFLMREKNNAQRCLHDCERLLNDPNVKSDSFKEGLRDLMCKTEDNYGTLLHLERVINMKNMGDLNPAPQGSKSIPILSASGRQSMSIAASAPQFTQTGRFRQQRVKAHETRRVFSLNEEADHDDFDPLQDDDLFGGGDNGQFSHHDIHDDDEDSGLMADDKNAAYKNRPSLQSKDDFKMAKSLPMKVPHRKFLLMDDNSPPDMDENTQDIPRKMAELARSLHVDSALGELPSPRLVD